MRVETEGVSSGERCGHRLAELQSPTKLLRHCTQTGNFREQKNPHPSPVPSIQSWGVCCILKVARTAAQYCMEGMGEEKLYFLLLESGKRQKAPSELGRSVSTHFVGHCRLSFSVHSEHKDQTICQVVA